MTMMMGGSRRGAVLALAKQSELTSYLKANTLIESHNGYERRVKTKLIECEYLTNGCAEWTRCAQIPNAKKRNQDIATLKEQQPNSLQQPKGARLYRYNERVR